MTKAKDCASLSASISASLTASLSASISVVCGFHSLEMVLILPFDRNSKQFFVYFFSVNLYYMREAAIKRVNIQAFKYKIVGRSVFTRKIDLVNSNRERDGALNCASSTLILL